jgi:APA family basic amino acid/polyamine antiporter
MMYGQTRVFYSMSRDGLIPPLFVRLHPTWRTPMFSQILFGILIAAAGAFFPIGILGSLTNMGTLVAFCLVALAVPLLRRRHPELVGAFNVPFGPYAVPILSFVSALGLIYYLKNGNPLVWGFFPLVWLGFLVWFGAGMIFYYSYGHRKSTVALQQTEGLAVQQPPVN